MGQSAHLDRQMLLHQLLWSAQDKEAGGSTKFNLVSKLQTIETLWQAGRRDGRSSSNAIRFQTCLRVLAVASTFDSSFVLLTKVPCVDVSLMNSQDCSGGTGHPHCISA